MLGNLISVNISMCLSFSVIISSVLVAEINDTRFFYLWRLFRSTFLIMTDCWNVLPTATVAVCRRRYEERQLTSSCPAVRVSLRPHGTTQLPLHGFSWNLLFEYFSKPCLENSSFVKIWQEERVSYMKTDTCFWSYLVQFFLEWELFQTDVVEQIKTGVYVQFFLSRKSCHLWDNVEKYFRAWKATDDDIIGRMRIACWITKATNMPLE